MCSETCGATSKSDVIIDIEVNIICLDFMKMSGMQ